jgi:hypothetical protein
MQWKTMNRFMKAQDGVARWMHALVLTWPNGCSINTWSKHIHFECKMGN